MRFYQSLSDRASDAELKNFWRELARQEGTHLQYWKKLIRLAEADKIKNLFDDPLRVTNELKNIQKTCEKLLSKTQLFEDTGRAMITTVRLEFHMLHPAFEAMFYIYENETGDPSPEKAYHRHLRFIMDGFGRFVQDKPEYVLIADMLLRIWDGNKQIARNLGEVRVLRGLIPICMFCKKIRDSAGYWSGVEDYIQKRADVQFSHGICETCMKEHYPDLED